MAIMKEFREFAVRGNVVDMAVGIIIGGAFTTIVKSLVSDVLMPPIGLLLADVDFADLFVVLKGQGSFTTLAEAQAAGAVTLNYGLFINNVISFLIVAWATFLLVRGLNRMKRREEEAAPVSTPPTPEIPEDIILLREIRDSLKPRA
ncbi:MAG: large conductance mechanosensitive channel protein MscL [Alcanivorax sp.]|uniref:Large-conductance mechanosensitive channel n=1 Tax=Alloalcanivorax marinus TaxID=1177169 RepID=A0A9Q3UKB9_9GAMM|nr:large conductance mechanosensitive channel protein MscL [Alloalcanivorax marinus]MBM7332163.1 large conductance mechanosensitive channel protein MscL [Alloalcanivorax marinus]MCC4307418.1 large conductance mechanosensitive channel protein MscL [Alloalcanivorax marinus]MCU5786813.1 large conductance mechanosensitive channel protein [Alloalcanivorax marinus]